MTSSFNRNAKTRLYIAGNYIYNARITSRSNDYLSSNIYTNESTRCYSTSKETLATMEKTILKQLTETILEVSRIKKRCSEIKDFKKHGFHKMFELMKKQDYMDIEPQSFIVDCLKFTNVDLFISGHFGCFDKIIDSGLNKEEGQILGKFEELEELSDPIEYYILRFCQKNSKITKGLSVREQIYCHSCILNLLVTYN